MMPDAYVISDGAEGVTDSSIKITVCGAHRKVLHMHKWCRLSITPVQLKRNVYLVYKTPNKSK